MFPSRLRNLREPIDLSDDCPLLMLLFWIKENLGGSKQGKDSSVYGISICSFSHASVDETLSLTDPVCDMWQEQRESAS